jgi:ubiquitin C-terminal hydrolase
VSNKRQRLRTSPCGSATANPSRSTPHPAQAAHAALTAHSASAPASRGLSIASTLGASTATFTKNRAIRNAGLVNNNVLCYANAIFQIIASCGCLNESLSNPPSMAHQHFRLYYNFASVISSMISGGNEAVNQMIFTTVFSERAPQFNNEQRKYLLLQIYCLKLDSYLLIN